MSDEERYTADDRLLLSKLHYRLTTGDPEPLRFRDALYKVRCGVWMPKSIHHWTKNIHVSGLYLGSKILTSDGLMSDGDIGYEGNINGRPFDAWGRYLDVIDHRTGQPYREVH